MRWADRGSNVLSKGQDGFTPLGEPVPAGEVDRDELWRPDARQRPGRAGGERRANLMFPFGLLVADLSRFMTLEPGDVILTGTPAGARPVEPGDEVEVEVEGVGRIRNRVVEAEAEIAPLRGAAARRARRPGRRARKQRRSRRDPASARRRGPADRLHRDADGHNSAAAESATP